MGPGLGMPGLPAACVCTRPSWQGLALRGPPAWVGTHCGSEPTGSHRWLCPGVVPGTRPVQGDGVLALAGGSDGTRHKHLEHTCIHVCVPHRHSMGTHVAYVGMHICTVHRGCAGSELVCSPPCTPPPCGPTGGCGCPSGWPGIAYKAGHSHKQRGHSPVLLPAPQWGRRLGST